MRIVQFYCVMTARGRLVSANIRRHWTLGGQTYNQDMFGSSADSRAVFVTPARLMRTE